MKTPTKYPNSLVDNDTKFLTSFKPVNKHNLFVDTGIETFPEKAKKGITVFLIDDDLMYLTAMEHFLSEEIPSLKIKTFQTGESSLMEMEQCIPDIVILDYYLDSEVASAKNGIEILKKIKLLNPDIKVIMLSCQDDIKTALVCIRNGAFDYVSKGETAFIRIKNILTNVAGNIDVIGKIKKHMKIFKIVNLIIIIMLILFFLLGH
jgi:two-component system, OmpR family, response regulator